MTKAKQTPKKKTVQKKSNTNTVATLKKIVAFMRDDRFRFILGIFVLFFAMLVTLAFISYLFTWKADQSELNKAITDIHVENWVGKFGARISNLFIHKWFGIASFGFVFMTILYGLRLIGLRPFPFWKSLKYSFFTIIWLSITLGFFFGSSVFYLGGAHGYFLSDLFDRYIGSVGTFFLIFLSLLAFIVFTFEGVFDKIKAKFKQLTKNEPASEDVEFDKVDFKPAEKPQIGQEVDFTVQTNKNQHKTAQSADEKSKSNETIDKQEYFINDKGEKVPIKDLGFEVENKRTPQNDKQSEEKPAEIEKPPIENDGQLLLRVEQNQDILVEEIDNEQFKLYDPTLELSHYKMPPLELLEDHRADNSEVTDEELKSNKDKIVKTLSDFKIEIIKIKAIIGPTITLYEIVPAPGIRISKIRNLEDDIALNLSALGIRIIAPMPGRGTIGIEVPNQKPEIVSMRSVISSKKFQNSTYELPIALGKTISNETYVFDLTKMPHLLVAGATGQGKSVGLNAIIASILYKKHPSEVKFVLVDPKKVELTLYEKIEKHYLATLPDADEPIITDNQKVIHTLSSLNIEMDNRYNLLKAAQVRNIKEYNEKFMSRRLNPLKGHRYLPYIVLIIDEFADLIMTAGKEIEFPVARIAQLARAIGIHLIVATQRPSTNIITGVIKANFPSRIAFKVASMIDSRTILDSPGANQLIGRGDMLITKGSELIRLQCAFIDTPELETITNFIGNQTGYPSAMLLPEYEVGDETAGAVDLANRDDLFDDAARIIVMNQQGSTSLIQRKLSIGYNRAGRIMDQLESAGIVGPSEGSKARQVYYCDELSLDNYLKSLN